MSITDAEIMGGVGFGYDDYEPIRQEPMGYNYRPESWKGSDNRPSSYSYDDYDTKSRHASIHNGIQWESPMKSPMNNTIGDTFLANKRAFETYFRSSDEKNKTDNTNKSKEDMSGRKESLVNLFSGQQGQFTFILLFVIVLFTIIAIGQQSQIKHMQNMLGLILMGNKTVTVVASVQDEAK